MQKKSSVNTGTGKVLNHMVPFPRKSFTKAPEKNRRDRLCQVSKLSHWCVTIKKNPLLCCNMATKSWESWESDSAGHLLMEAVSRVDGTGVSIGSAPRFFWTLQLNRLKSKISLEFLIFLSLVPSFKSSNFNKRKENIPRNIIQTKALRASGDSRVAKKTLPHKLDNSQPPEHE